MNVPAFETMQNNMRLRSEDYKMHLSENGVRGINVEIIVITENNKVSVSVYSLSEDKIIQTPTVIIGQVVAEIN
jgi:hypothetical protein